MGIRLFGRKQKQQAAAVEDTISTEQSAQSSAQSGPNPVETAMASLKDILAPGGIDRSNPDILRVGPMWTRTLAVTGLPSEISIGWLQPFLQHDGHLDLSIHINPYEERQALAHLVHLITRLKAQWRFVAQLTGISDDIQKAAADAERIRDMIAANQTRLFRFSVLASVHDREKERAIEAADMLDSRLAGRRIYSKGLETRQDEAYLSVLPIGLNFCNDVGRNLDSFALATAMPFTDADLVMPGGYQLGINMRTLAPILYNPYKLNNHNIVVYAASGSGKSATVKTMIGRALFTGEVAAVLDPEGEYALAAQVLGGVCLPIGPGSPFYLNPFDIGPETTDDGAEIVDIDAKIIDLVELIRTMVGVPLSADVAAVETSVIEFSLRELYRRFGITRDPASLYERQSAVEDASGTITYGKRLKRMPQLSDFVEILKEVGARADRVREALGPYVGDGVLSFFDHQSNVNIDGMPVTVFDLSRLDNRWGKPIALQVALTWLWNSFVNRRQRTQKKRVIVDEAWLMAAHEPAMAFLENMVRRARKRTAGLTVISQDFRKFALHPMGQAIHSNSSTFLFLKAEDHDLDDIQNTFKLSQGERNFIAQAGKGEGILRVGGRTIPFKVLHTPGEQQWVYTTPLKEAASG